MRSSGLTAILLAVRRQNDLDWRNPVPQQHKPIKNGLFNKNSRSKAAAGQMLRSEPGRGAVPQEAPEETADCFDCRTLRAKIV